MQRLRFYKVGAVSPPLVHNLVYQLNAIQDAFTFDIEPNSLPVPVEPVSGRFDEDAIDRHVASLNADRHPGDFPLAICDLPFPEDVSSSFNEVSAIISVNGWRDRFPRVAPDRIVAFHLLDVLLTRRLAIPSHSDTRGCPSDYCDDASERIKGIEVCDFCAECRAVIRRAIGSGAIPLGEAVAVFRILDWIANRRRVFVVMPFGGCFDEIYREVVAPAVSALGWECLRADDVTQAAEIMTIIREEIRRASLVIADLSERNPNVFYEVGYAHALNRPTVLLCRELKDVPFDLNHHQVVQYTLEVEKRSEVCNRLRLYLETL